MILDPAADEFLDTLHRADPHSAERVEAALDRLEDDPSSLVNRRHRLVPPGDDRVVWGFAVGEHMVLWHEQGQDVHVLHIGDNRLL